MHLYPCVHVCVYVCMFICTVQSFYYMRVRVYGGIGSGVGFSLFMVSACFWRGRLCFGRGGDRGFCLVYFSIFAGVRVVGVIKELAETGGGRHGGSRREETRGRHGLV